MSWYGLSLEISDIGIHDLSVCAEGMKEEIPVGFISPKFFT